MITKTAPSYPFSIFMAGSIEHAILHCQEYCDEEGYCVTVTPTTYVYRNGQEPGFIVGLINYPRFPSTPDEIFRIARDIADKLRLHLYQDSYSIQTPTETHWFSWRDECGLCGGSFTDEAHAMLSGDCPTEAMTPHSTMRKDM